LDRIENRSVLVTGGTKGIGLAIALHFSRPGSRLFLNYASDDSAAERAKAEVERRGAACHLVKQDVGTPRGAAAAILAVESGTDRLDLLVHGAVRVVAAPVLEVDLEAFTRAVELNGLSLLYLVQAALPLLRRGSSVVLLTSRGGRVVVKNYAAVGAAKSLAEGLMRYLAVELAPRGVRINAVAPGMVETEALRAVFGEEASKLVAQSAAANPSGRGIRDEDYCALVEFLAMPEAEMIQGQVIFVNGGKDLSA
jgi:NAD(P)-dependent dehydrogenase (short-subunit alcohol dehydrogenase family)